MICFDENLYIKAISTVHKQCLVEMLIFEKANVDVFCRLGMFLL